MLVFESETTCWQLGTANLDTEYPSFAYSSVVKEISNNLCRFTIHKADIT